MAGQQLGLPLSYSPVPIFLPWIRIPRMMSPCAEKFYFRKKGGGIIMEQTKIREQVIDDLKQYPELKKKVILLRYEQEHPRQDFRQRGDRQHGAFTAGERRHSTGGIYLR